MTDAAFRIGGRPFDRARLRQLVEYLGHHHCEHDHRHTFEWACVEGFDGWRLLELLGYYAGMACACEVAHNAEPALFDAVGLKRLPRAGRKLSEVPAWSRRFLRVGRDASQRAAFGLTRERPN